MASRFLRGIGADGGAEASVVDADGTSGNEAEIGAEAAAGASQMISARPRISRSAVGEDAETADEDEDESEDDDGGGDPDGDDRGGDGGDEGVGAATGSAGGRRSSVMPGFNDAGLMVCIGSGPRRRCRAAHQPSIIQHS